MESFWEESYDGVKDRRYGLLFFGTLLVFFGAVVLGAMIYGIAGPDNFREFVLSALPGIGVLLLILCWCIVRRAWKRRQDQLKYQALSRDELVKARSKLRTETRPVSRAALREQDIDLKY